MSQKKNIRLRGLTAKGETRKYVQHEYVDRSSDVYEVETRNDRNVLKMYEEGTVAGPFPVKLQTLLRMTHKLGMDDIISWQVHGRSFQVRCPKKFESVAMRKFFNQTKISSFRRQLNLYDFKRLTHGPDSGSYYHEMFLRGKPLQASQMSRTRVKGTKFRATSSPDKEPNFYGLPFLPAYEDFNNEVPKAPEIESTSQSEDTCEGSISNKVVDDLRTTFSSAPQNINTHNKSMYREFGAVKSRGDTQLGFPDLSSSFVPPSTIDLSSSGGPQNEKERHEVGQLLVGMQQNFQNLHQKDQTKNRKGNHIFNQISANVNVHTCTHPLNSQLRHFPSLKEMQELQQRVNEGNADSTEVSRNHPTNSSTALIGDGPPQNYGWNIKSSINVDSFPCDSSSLGNAMAMESNLSPFASASASASTTGSALLSNFSQMSEYENLQQAILMNKLEQRRLEQQRLEMDSSSSSFLDSDCRSSGGINVRGGGNYRGAVNLSMSQHSINDAQELLKSTITSGSYDTEGTMMNSTSV